MIAQVNWSAWTLSAIISVCAFIFGATAWAAGDDTLVHALANRFHSGPQCSLGGISIGVIRNGRPTLYSIGTVRSSSGDPHEARENDRFEIGSITKTFTAIIYSLALDEGKVTSNEPAQDLMPEGVVLPVFRTAEGRQVQITLDQLARHASGLPRAVRGSPSGMSRAQMIAKLNSAQLLFEPGTKFFYSNLGFAVLSMAMERVYGSPIENLFTKVIADPLGMSRTAVGSGPFSSNDLIAGYRPDGSEAPRANPTWPAFDGSAALRSTPADMLKYLRYNMRLFDAGALTTALSTLQKTEQLPRYEGDKGETVDIGLAWQDSALPDGRRLVWKNGNVPGFRSFIGFTGSSPQTGVVVLASQNGCMSGKLGRCIIEALDQTRQDGYCENPDSGSGNTGSEMP